MVGLGLRGYCDYAVVACSALMLVLLSEAIELG